MRGELRQQAELGSGHGPRWNRASWPFHPDEAMTGRAARAMVREQGAGPGFRRFGVVRGKMTSATAYLGGSGAFDQTIAGFAETYADQNERDYAVL